MLLKPPLTVKIPPIFPDAKLLKFRVPPFVELKTFAPVIFPELLMLFVPSTVKS